MFARQANLAWLCIVHIFGQVLAAPAWKSPLASPYANELKKCKAEWLDISKREDPQEISSCLKSLLMSVEPNLVDARGIYAINIDRFDPLLLPNPIELGGNNQPFKAIITKTTITGITKGLVPESTTVAYDKESKVATIKVIVPKQVSVEADYDIDLNPGVLFGQENSVAAKSYGRVTAYFADPTCTLIVGMGKTSKGELRVRSSRSTIEGGEFKLNFKGNDPSDTMPSLMNSMLSPPEASTQILNQILPSVNTEFATALGKLYHAGWRNLEKMIVP